MRGSGSDDHAHPHPGSQVAPFRDHPQPPGAALPRHPRRGRSRYRLAVALDAAGLDAAHRRRRERLEAWFDEQVRASQPKNDKERRAVRERLLGQAVKEAGATLLNRLVLLRHLEAKGLSRPEIVTGGWGSKGYQELRDFAPALLSDDTEGYGVLLQMVFDERSLELRLGPPRRAVLPGAGSSQVR